MDILRYRGNPAVLSFFIILIAAALFSAEPVQAQSSEMIIFKRIGLLYPEDRTSKNYGRGIGEQVWREIEETIRFEIIPPEQWSKTPSLSQPALIELGKSLKLDGIITGHVDIRDDVMNIGLTLMEAGNGQPFAREFISVRDWEKSGSLERGVKTLANKLIGRIPYQAVVTEVRDQGKTVVVDAGRIHGLDKGMKLRVVQFTSVKRHPFTQEVIGVEKADVGELIVTQADERSSLTKPFHLEKGRFFAENQYVLFKPSEPIKSETAARRAELLAGKEAERAVTEKAAIPEKQTEESELSKGDLGLSVGPAWSNFSLNSDQVKFNQTVTAFPLLGLSGEYWLFRSFGFDASYQIGFAKLDRLDAASISVRARPSWWASHLKYRYVLKPGRTNLQLIGHVGYASYSFQVSETDPQFLNQVSYQGLTAGFESRFSITAKTAGRIGLDLQPRLVIHEHPVTSGEGSDAFSISAHADGRYQFQPGLWLSIRYLYRNFIAGYSGLGSRAPGMTGTKTRDYLNTMTFGFIKEF